MGKNIFVIFIALWLFYAWKRTILHILKGNNSCNTYNFRIKSRKCANGLWYNRYCISRRENFWWHDDDICFVLNVKTQLHLLVYWNTQFGPSCCCTMSHTWQLQRTDTTLCSPTTHLIISQLYIVLTTLHHCISSPLFEPYIFFFNFFFYFFFFITHACTAHNRQ